MSITANIYTEGAINIDLSAYSHFRFETCEGYRNISGANIKEIDFGWWNDDEECLYLLEIKDYTANPNRIVKKDESRVLIENLWKKSVDVIVMLSSVWLDNIGSREIKSCLPIHVQRKCKIKIFHLLKCDKSLEPHLSPINDKLKDRFRGYKQLYENILTFKIISARQAEKIFKGLLSFDS
jgi:hypothetical protein